MNIRLHGGWKNLATEQQAGWLWYRSPCRGSLYSLTVQVPLLLREQFRHGNELSEGMTKPGKTWMMSSHELQKEIGLSYPATMAKHHPCRSDMLIQRKETNQHSYLNEHLKAFSPNYFGEAFASNLAEAQACWINWKKWKATFIDLEYSLDERKILLIIQDNDRIIFFSLMENLKLLNWIKDFEQVAYQFSVASLLLE